MDARHDVVVVGAGHAGAQVAIALRQRKFAGSVALVGDEPELPYERPPLSKDYLAGERAFERLLIRPAAFWNQRDVTMVLGERVATVDPAARRLTTESCRTIGYGELVWAAGGQARRLACPGHGLPGVHTVRNRADVDRMTAELATTNRVAVVGGGYIGLEAAAVLTKLGKQVTVIEALDRVLARVAGEQLSRFYEAEHRAHGVDVRLNSSVAAIEATSGRATGLLLATGEMIATDMVIAGIGIAPATGPLQAAGAEGRDGVMVDSQGRTSLPHVWAAGDCALHANRFATGPIRLESVQNANDMATVVARAIMGEAEPSDTVPWFWSNQYDVKLQTAGLSGGHDATVTRGKPATRSFSLIYLRQGRVIALDCVNTMKDFVQGKRLVSDGLVIEPAVLADTAIGLSAM